MAPSLCRYCCLKFSYYILYFSHIIRQQKQIHNRIFLLRRFLVECSSVAASTRPIFDGQTKYTLPFICKYLVRFSKRKKAHAGCLTIQRFIPTTVGTNSRQGHSTRNNIINTVSEMDRTTLLRKYHLLTLLQRLCFYSPPFYFFEIN